MGGQPPPSPGMGTPKRYGYGENTKDLSTEWADNSSASDSNTSESKGGPSWELCFSRFVHLDDINSTLEVILTDEELFEAAELYVSTYDHHTQGNQGMRNGHGNSPESPERESYAQSLLQRLQLLRGWKAFLANNDNTEELLAGLEEVLNLDQDSLDPDNLLILMDVHSPRLQQIFVDLALELVTPFVLSSDFAAYQETHTEVKAHNKKLRTDSKSWVGKFQKATNNHATPFHLFSFGGGRPFANKKMRSIFGPMCDAPSPKEYIDGAGTDALIVGQVEQCMKSGTDCCVSAVVRTLKQGKRACQIRVRHIRSHKQPEQIKFSLVLVTDATGDDAQRRLHAADCLMQCIPIDE